MNLAYGTENLGAARVRQKSMPKMQPTPIELSPPSGGVRSPFRELSQILQAREGEQHLVILQGAPDPDAIASALALEFINLRFNIATTILTFQHVSHTENRAMVKKLNIDLVRYDETFDLSPYSGYSIVDSQKFYTPIDIKLQDQNVQFIAFIDHHREDLERPPALFVDTRQSYSSTAAILCEYLREIGELDDEDPLQVRLATALMHGLRVDSQRFLLATEHEYKAAAFIASTFDRQVIEQIERRVMTNAMMEMLENALVNRHVHDNFIFSDVGFVRSVDRDGIPQAAELLLNREGTDTVLVFGIVDEKFIDGSFRTRSETINPDEFLKGCLGISPESGRYYGGGNVRDRGGFQIPLGFFSLHPDKERVYAIAKEVLERSFLDYIGKNERKSS